MRYTITVLMFFLTINVFAQTTADFENITLTPNSFLNGNDYSGGFYSGNVFLPNNFFYYGNYPVWDGWMISNNTDTVTAGFGNESSCIAGSGNNSENFAVAYLPGGFEQKLNLQGNAVGATVNGFYINNNTYAYLSMKNGDTFAKKFGGLSGDDEDYFLLTIKKYYNGNLSTDSINFYLADFRFADNTQDYIVKDWTYVDLTSLGNVDSLSFTLSSSDVGVYGINTPTYFCMDNLETSDGIVSAAEFEANQLIKFSTSNQQLNVYSELNNAQLNIYNLNGVLEHSEILNIGNQLFTMKLNANNMYVATILQDNNVIFSEKFVW